MERINDSIRTYMWAILGSQAQTRSSILGTRIAFNVQKQFLENVEDAISFPVDLPLVISRYQSVLRNVRSKVDLFGIGLYMPPSDMRLYISSSIQGYNNEIVIASSDLQLVGNAEVNSEQVPTVPSNTTLGTRNMIAIIQPLSGPPQRPSTPSVQVSVAADSMKHEDEKTARIIGSIAAGSAALWFSRRCHTQ